MPQEAPPSRRPPPPRKQSWQEAEAALLGLAPPVTVTAEGEAASGAPALAAAEGAGFHKRTPCFRADQAHTLKLFERLRFTTVGTHEKRARVDGAWHDVVVEKFLR